MDAKANEKLGKGGGGGGEGEGEGKGEGKGKEEKIFKTVFRSANLLNV